MKNTIDIKWVEKLLNERTKVDIFYEFVSIYDVV